MKIICDHCDEYIDLDNILYANSNIWEYTDYNELAYEFFRGNFDLKKFLDIIGKNNIDNLKNK